MPQVRAGRHAFEIAVAQIRQTQLRRNAIVVASAFAPNGGRNLPSRECIDFETLDSEFAVLIRNKPERPFHFSRFVPLPSSRINPVTVAIRCMRNSIPKLKKKGRCNFVPVLPA